MDRITGYFDAMLDRLAGIDFRYGCLLGNLAVDTATDEPAVAAHVDEVFDAWVARLATAVRAAQDQGDVAAALDADLVAAQLVDLWEGAALRAKARRDGDLTRRVVTDGVRRLLGVDPRVARALRVVPRRRSFRAEVGPRVASPSARGRSNRA